MATLWDRMTNWSWRKMKFKEGRDYTFIDINREMDDGEIDKITGIGILKGKYKGVVLMYPFEPDKKNLNSPYLE